MTPRSDQNKLVEWLNALIVMAQWDKTLPSYVARLFNKPDQYQKALQLIRKGPQEEAPARPGDALSDREWRKLYKLTTRAESLRKLFGDGRDPFDRARQNEILLLADLSDLTTDAQTVFYSQNGTFQLVLETVRQRPELDTASLITDGLNKFYTLVDTNKRVAEDLYQLACTNNWHTVLASLYDARDYTTDESPTAKESLEKWNKDLTTALRQILLRPTKLYRVPQKLIKLAWERQNLFTIAHGSIPPDKRLTEFELRQQVANVAYPMFVREATEKIEEIESDLQILAVIARHYISVRKFVKLDGLVAGWPKIASLAMANFRNLEYVEDFFVEKKQRPSTEELEQRDARELYERCANDQMVIRFLRLRPYFKEIDEDELRRYRPLAPVTISDPAQPPAPTVITPPAAERGVATEVTATSITPARIYEIVIQPAESPSLDPEITVYDISLSGAGTAVATKANLSLRKLLDQVLISVGVTNEESLQSVMNSVFSAVNPEQTLIRGGAQLLKTFIAQTGFEEKLADEFRDQGPVRLVIASDFHQVQYLPWEWLPRPGYAELLLSDPRFSLVRSTSSRKEPATAPITSPVRILGVFPNTPVGARDISESSIKALELLANEGADYTGLVHDNASVIRLTDELAALRPAIVHFEGYVNFLSDADPNLAFVFSSLTQSTEAIHWSRFGELLSSHNVQLVVIGRNESSRILGNAGPAIAYYLIESGVPAVLAPVRAVDEATATSFATEFYRAFLAGNSLEQAVYIARRKVAARGGDWTPFALFGDPSVFDFFQPLPARA